MCCCSLTHRKYSKKYDISHSFAWRLCFKFLHITLSLISCFLVLWNEFHWATPVPPDKHVLYASHPRPQCTLTNIYILSLKSFQPAIRLLLGISRLEPNTPPSSAALGTQKGQSVINRLHRMHRFVFLFAFGFCVSVCLLKNTMIGVGDMWVGKSKIKSLLRSTL